MSVNNETPIPQSKHFNSRTRLSLEESSFSFETPEQMIVVPGRVVKKGKKGFKIMIDPNELDARHIPQPIVASSTQLPRQKRNKTARVQPFNFDVENVQMPDTQNR